MKVSSWYIGVVVETCAAELFAHHGYYEVKKGE